FADGVALHGAVQGTHECLGAGDGALWSADNPTASGNRDRTNTRGGQLRQTDVAIIGWHVRFPGANTIDEFWQNLRNGVESITFFTPAELAAAGYDDEMVRSERFVPAAPVIDGIEDFDASFFGFSPRDAELTDPQYRIFIEEAWSAL